MTIARRRRQAKINGDRQTFVQLNLDFQREARKDKVSQINQECEKIEEYNKRGMTRDLFRKIRNLQGQITTKNGTLVDHKGKQISNGEEIKNKWKE